MPELVALLKESPLCCLSSPLRGRSLVSKRPIEAFIFPGIGSERIGLIIPCTDSLSGRDRDKKAFLISLFRLLDALLGLHWALVAH